MVGGLQRRVKTMELMDMPADALSRVMTFLDFRDVVVLGACSSPLREIVQADQIWKCFCQRWSKDVPLEQWVKKVNGWKALFRLLRSLSEVVGTWSARSLAPRGGLLFSNWDDEAECSVVAHRIMPEWIAQGLVCLRLFKVVGNSDGSARVMLLTGKGGGALSADAQSRALPGGSARKEDVPLPGALVWNDLGHSDFHLELLVKIDQTKQTAIAGREGGNVSSSSHFQQTQRQQQQQQLISALQSRAVGRSMWLGAEHGEPSPLHVFEEFINRTREAGGLTQAQRAATGNAGQTAPQQQHNPASNAAPPPAQPGSSPAGEQQAPHQPQLRSRAMQYLVRFAAGGSVSGNSSITANVVPSTTLETAAITGGPSSIPTIQQAGSSCAATGSQLHVSIGRQAEQGAGAAVQSSRALSQIGKTGQSFLGTIKGPGGESPEGMRAVKQVMVPASRYRRLEVAQAELGREMAGIWSGCYGPHGLEIISATYDGHMLIATKILGDPNVPCDEVTFRANLNAEVVGDDMAEVEDGHNLVRSAAHDEAGQLLMLVTGEGDERDNFPFVTKMYKGEGRIAGYNFQCPQWVEGLLLLDTGGRMSFLWKDMNFMIRFCRLSLSALVKQQQQQ
eukprot:TRINITY_DN771_c0_g1_i8.p1 TRINITY_DN771_c0_g1~~TRINITY_DN771_c0_g1_i8.p1  ORF type:complete len:637 (+),score=167.39 TRINITY_DN771_c0_g1_i8:54-1913(+)